MEDGRGFFEGWLVDRIKGIIIGCLIGGGAWFFGHWGMAHYVSIYDAVAVISKVWDGLGIANGLFLVMALVLQYGEDS